MPRNKFSPQLKHKLKMVNNPAAQKLRAFTATYRDARIFTTTTVSFGQSSHDDEGEGTSHLSTAL